MGGRRRPTGSVLRSPRLMAGPAQLRLGGRDGLHDVPVHALDPGHDYRGKMAGGHGRHARCGRRHGKPDTIRGLNVCEGFQCRQRLDHFRGSTGPGLPDRHCRDPLLHRQVPDHALRSEAEGTRATAGPADACELRALGRQPLWPPDQCHLAESDQVQLAQDATPSWRSSSGPSS